ncbi:hypothetical protein HDG38_006350 [Paraburkholderia sp. WSM4177]|nr:MULTISPECIES: hypothetical protein [unclassified Paraburkholderia]MBB5447705.1 hypothetical protein [Paraburkholderia sp. WSM4177]MBB5488119.1 hypothetical protein [Paraburkholderia sp. WSM4180]
MLSDDTLLFVVDSPVEREPTPLATVDKPVEAEALSEEMPVDAEVLSDETPVLRLDTAVDVEVERVSIAEFVAKSCEPLIASVLAPVTRPAATFVI